MGSPSVFENRDKGTRTQPERPGWVAESRPGKAVTRQLGRPPSHHLEVGHHAHVLMFEFVAVHEVETFVGVEADEHLHGLAVG